MPRFTQTKLRLSHNQFPKQRCACRAKCLCVSGKRVLQARHKICGRLDSCSDTSSVGDPWTSQLAPCVFATERTHTVCRKRQWMTFSDKPGLHTTFHDDSGSNSLGPGKGVWPSVPSSHIVLQVVLCQAEGPSQGNFGSCRQLQAVLQSSHGSYHIT